MARNDDEQIEWSREVALIAIFLRQWFGLYQADSRCLDLDEFDTRGASVTMVTDAPK